jgi:ech hydrogenase subunit A
LFPYYLALAILAPITFALYFRVSGNSRLRRAAVFFVCAVILLCAGWPVVIGKASYRPGTDVSPLLHYFFAGGNVAAVLGICYAARRWRDWLLAGVGLGQAATLAWLLYAAGGPSLVGGFALDHLSGLLLLLTNAGSAMTLLFAADTEELPGRRRVAGKRGLPQLWVMGLLLLSAVQGILLSDQLFWMLLFLQIAVLSATGLIAAGGSNQALRRARDFLRISSLANLGVLAGIAMLPSSARSLPVTDLLLFSDAAILLPALTCVVTAGMIFTGQLPFQNFFLRSLSAYFSVAALLQTCTLVVAGCYLFLRFSPLFINTWLGNIAAVAGAFSFSGAALLAALQRRQDRALTFTTVSSMGLVLTLACFPQLPAIYAALLLVVWHGLAKALLLLELGENSSGAMGTAALLAAVSLMLPPFGAPLAQSVALEAAGRNPATTALLIAGIGFSLIAWSRYIISWRLIAPSTFFSAKASRQKLVAQGCLSVGILASSLFGVPLANYFGVPALQENFSRFDDVAQGSAGVFSLQDFAGVNPLMVFAGIAGLFVISWGSIKMLTARSSVKMLPLPEPVDESAGQSDLTETLIDEATSAVDESQTMLPAEAEATTVNESAAGTETEPVEELIQQSEPRPETSAENVANGEAATIAWGGVFRRIPDERRIERYATMIAGALIVLMFEVINR